MYKYEMHMHSCPCSGGGKEIEKHIDTLLANGFSGAVITNHFYRGDNRIDRSLPWEDFILPYEEDYLRGKEYAKAKDFDLLFGIEEHLGEGKEILIYGITPDVLRKNPQLKHGDIKEYLKVIHEAGGLVFQAHPYRARHYITNPGPLDCVEALDGIEVYNAANAPEENAQARELANSLGLRCTAGSDAHSPEWAGKSAVCTKERARTEADLVRILLSGDYEIMDNEKIL